MDDFWQFTVTHTSKDIDCHIRCHLWNVEELLHLHHNRMIHHQIVDVVLLSLQTMQRIRWEQTHISKLKSCLTKNTFDFLLCIWYLYWNQKAGSRKSEIHRNVIDIYIVRIGMSHHPVYDLHHYSYDLNSVCLIHMFNFRNEYVRKIQNFSKDM